MPKPVIIHFGIDRGGTFTDVYARVEGVRHPIVLKLLSEDPLNYEDAPREGIRRVLCTVLKTDIPRSAKIPTENIGSIRMGTTVATNALLTRTGASTALVITSGFKNLLEIGNQSRPGIFDLDIPSPEMLYRNVISVQERIVIHNAPGETYVRGNTTGEFIEIRKKLDLEKLRTDLQELFDTTDVRSLAIVLMHSYAYPNHEEQIESVAKEIGFTTISRSSKLTPMVKIVSRGFTASADSYLTPVLHEYIASFTSGFTDIEEISSRISFMQSDGGLSDLEAFSGYRAILSGPAGGVVGYARSTRTKNNDPVIGFDMGGTSSDVSRVDKRFEHVMETEVAGITIQAPQLDIKTVAAGGGSCLVYQDGIFNVGPESAGANPGPVCYRKEGGKLSITDANVALGRVLPSYFPKIFGPEEDSALDVDASLREFDEMARTTDDLKGYSRDEVAFGFIKVANEAMCRPIRNLTQMKGYDVSKHTLAVFGGAGPQHACAMAKSLGIKTVYCHRYSGILSAYGLMLADVVTEQQRPCSLEFNSSNLVVLEEQLEELRQSVTDDLIFKNQKLVSTISYLNMRYKGTDVAVMTMTDDDSNLGYKETFLKTYEREFGFTLDKDRPIIVDDIRVRGIGVSSSSKVENQVSEIENQKSKQQLVPDSTTSVYFETLGRVDTPVYVLEDLNGGSRITGPAIIMQNVATVVIEPNCTAEITIEGDILIHIAEQEEEEVTIDSADKIECDPIQLSLYAHRFMGIAEQMGKTLQRTSVSVNIKERLDFSCAIFSPDGSLVANAPHLPVHLGSMQQAVKFQISYWKDDLHSGDVLMSNHPQLAGGSHLPDITVMTPVFSNEKIIFFVASRGHHSDIGGIAPGSMPPLSTTLDEEGAAMVAMKIVTSASGFKELEISDWLNTKKSELNVGTRNLSDNLSDLRAQVAANARGVSLVLELVAAQSLNVVHAYMDFIQENAEAAVRRMLLSFNKSKMEASDYMDDGSRIALCITIDKNTGDAIFDFTGTDVEVMGNINAPPSVTYSAVIYCLRALVDITIPLNQGCLNPITIIIPSGSILNPSSAAAVVGGNVLTSQRVTDVILKAFEACAASQGCMNNLTFGSKDMGGYYETIAGGAGAGPSWNGRSGVHTHMTNTRITDPEILERRYPVLLREFSLRAGSGGEGLYCGGDGVVRELEFLKPLTVSILSERRVIAPYGMAGGKPGERGKNLWIKNDGKTSSPVSIGGKNTINTSVGDVLRIETPGGGGYGTL